MGNDPCIPGAFVDRSDLAGAATSRELRGAARHRWFYFPHSYSFRLVDAVLDYWQFPPGAVLVDPFCGAGTTLLAGRDRRLAVEGFDVSPLAVAVTRGKVASYDRDVLATGLRGVLNSPPAKQQDVPRRLARAFTDEELAELCSLLRRVQQFEDPRRLFFVVAALATAKLFSRAVPDGGWFRWKQWPDRSSEIRTVFERTALMMLDDIQPCSPGGGPPVTVTRGDARDLSVASATVDGVVTSPPYPNRHDYTRVFHIELLLLGLTEPEVTALRRRSLRSHVEAKPPHAPRLEGYVPPGVLEQLIGALPHTTDNRVRRLLWGYFEDLYLSLVETSRVLRPGGRVAYVVGNVRYGGVMLPVDELTVRVAEQAGLVLDEGWVIRVRGNAAQQMGHHGRVPSRESVLLLSKPV